MLMRSNQRGFTFLEVILLVVIAIGVGGTGWYVVNSTHKTQTQHDKISKPPPETPKSGSSSPTSSTGKFVFKEIGVEITLPTGLSGLTYKTSNSGGTVYLNLTTPQFVTAVHNCNSTIQDIPDVPFASISKVAGQYNQANNPGVGNLKQFKDFWVRETPAKVALCDTSSVKSTAYYGEVLNQVYTALKEAFDTADLVQ